MKQPIRAFSVGLFTSGIILLIIFIFFGDTNKTKTQLSDEEMTAALEDKGYHVLSDADYVSWSVGKDEDKDGEKDKDQNESEDDSNNDEDQDKNDDANDEEDENDDKDKSDKKETYSITIEEGMASSDIGADLEKHDIIDDAAKFNKFLHDEGYDLKVQIGKFKVSDDMDFDEIADAITK